MKNQRRLMLNIIMLALVLLLAGCSGNRAEPEQIPDERAAVSESRQEQAGMENGITEVISGKETDRGFLLDNVLKTEDLGEIHFNISVPDSYDGTKAYALHIAMPGWEGLYFQGAGEDLRWEYLPFESKKYIEDMIVVSLQFGDWGNDSARQAVRFTVYMLSAYNIDTDRVYITGYSAGGETLSRVMELAPELYSGALFVSSKWDGDPQPLVDAKIPLCLFTSEHDSYYGAEPVRSAWQNIHDLYVTSGLSEDEISRILLLDVREDAWFDAVMEADQERTDKQYARDYHGAGMLVAFDESIMKWVFRGNNDTEKAMNTYTKNTEISEVINDPAFGDYGRLIFPVNSGYYSGSMMGDLRLTWYNNIDPDKTVEITNYMKSHALAGDRIFYNIYTEEEKAADPSKEDTGLFFFKGDPGARFAICNAGGGMVFVGAMHDSFPHALELSKMGYNAFALIYRPGAQTACEDLARAIAFIFEHAEDLEVDTSCYSLWGGSAGARMAAWLGSYGTESFGEKAYPRPAAVIMQYTGLSEVYGNEPPTYNCVGTSDGIASYRSMQARIDAIRANGTNAEIEVFQGLSHGFGLGTGTVADGWLDNAVEFWERNMN